MLLVATNCGIDSTLITTNPTRTTKRTCKYHKHEWFWTIDNDVTCENVPNYTPEPVNYNKVHAWQRANPTTGIAHSYGGVRLWPKQLPDITSDDIKLNKMPRGQLQYVKDIASEYNKYEIYVISYKEDINIVDEHIHRITNKGVWATHTI